MLLYALTIFASAFLLFQVEPIVAKLILPRFGGSAAVWITCLLFFQLGLLLGYQYACALILKLRPKTQVRVHIGFIGASLLALPVFARHAWFTSLSMPVLVKDPALQILVLLALSIGLPYFLLSATGPVLQAWYSERWPAETPYPLFALSNAGSMLALLSYPVLIEPNFSTRHQVVAWSLTYAGFALLCVTVALKALRGIESATPARPDPAPPPGVAPPPAWGLLLLWAALAACGSTFLLAVTNHLTQNVAPVPFLWVLPLSLYLGSFIVCFRGWYRRGLFLRLLAVALGGMAYGLAPEFVNASLKLLIPLYCSGLFFGCIVCHGELERLKPHSLYLTSFYRMIAMGGAAGGVFVGLLAPRLFRGFYELPIAIGSTAILVLIALHRDPSSAFYRARWQPTWLALVALVVALIVSAVVQVRKDAAQARLMLRNFYGSLRVLDLDSLPREPALAGMRALEPARRKLMNGTIEHGIQFLAVDRRRQPTTYYGPRSGAALAIAEAARRGPTRVGVIGLGAGTLATYGRSGDRYTFYELNPLVIELARTEFSFLKDSAAQIEVVPGDARISLEREPPQDFDVLAVDAFTGDSIPIHLLTREAFVLYFRHLKTTGVLAVHVSNRYLELQPVVRRAAEALGKRAAVVHNGKDDANEVYRATWVLVSGRADFFDAAEIKGVAAPLATSKSLRLWTDDYSNLLGVLK